VFVVESERRVTGLATGNIPDRAGKQPLLLKKQNDTKDKQFRAGNSAFIFKN
jgi:hypothetical protein